jgi:hypothetical protein
MKFADPTNLDRKSGGSGGICGFLNWHALWMVHLKRAVKR